MKYFKLLALAKVKKFENLRILKGKKFENLRNKVERFKKGLKGSKSYKG